MGNKRATRGAYAPLRGLMSEEVLGLQRDDVGAARVLGEEEDHLARSELAADQDRTLEVALERTEVRPDAHVENADRDLGLALEVELVAELHVQQVGEWRRMRQVTEGHHHRAGRLAQLGDVDLGSVDELARQGVDPADGRVVIERDVHALVVAHVEQGAVLRDGCGNDVEEALEEERIRRHLFGTAPAGRVARAGELLSAEDRPPQELYGLFGEDQLDSDAREARDRQTLDDDGRHGATSFIRCFRSENRTPRDEMLRRRRQRTIAKNALFVKNKAFFSVLFGYFAFVSAWWIPKIFPSVSL